MKNGRLQGRVAVVTGASRRQGIGAAICRALAAEGAGICFTYWHDYDATQPHGADREGPAALQAELQGLGVPVAALAVDLAQPDAAAAVLDAAERALGLPDILVNNAAHSTNDGFRNLDAATLDAHYALNVRSACLLSVLFARRRTGRGGGRIINLTSGQAKGPMPGELAYVASKGAIEAFTVTLAAEVGALGITVNAIDPGPTDSGWMSDAVKEAVVSRFPSRRIGQPADAARLAAFLASDDAQWITGQVIHSDGGYIDDPQWLLGQG